MPGVPKRKVETKRGNRMKRNTMELTGARLKAAENWYKRQVKNGAQPHCVIDSTGCKYLFCIYGMEGNKRTDTGGI